MFRFILCCIFGVREITVILSGWKNPKIPPTLWFSLCHDENHPLYWHLTLGCLFGNLLPFLGWFLESLYKFIAWNILTVCSVRFFCVCVCVLSRILAVTSNLLLLFEQLHRWCSITPLLYCVVCFRQKRTCLETWMSAVLWNWCSVSLPGLYLIRKPQ